MAERQGTAAPESGREWPVYGGSNASDRYSPLRQITRDNVAQLEEAWRFDTGESGGFQVNPIVVHGVLYSPTPKHHVVALDAATGARRWTFDSGLESRGPNRGVSYWEDGTERRLFVAADQYLYALDAGTGVPVPAFGDHGRLDLRRGLGREPATQSIRLTTPGIVYRDLLIIGGRAGEGAGASPGDIRALDVRTGAVKWTFRTIPHPGETGYDTWGETSWQVNGGANNWAGMALDERRGIVFVPTGSAAPDFHGADRPGDNLFANTLLALDAATGKRLWHFQAVHHDIWDRDFPAPPTLVTVRRAGRAVDAVAQTTKHGYVFVLDRETGAPLFPVEERPVPASRIAGERAARTQPVPARPAPFARQRLTAELLTRRTPAAHAWALAEFAKFHTEGPFTPLRLGQDTVVFPGFDGGAEWGGSAYDPATGHLFVNANDLAWTGALAPDEAGSDGRALYLQSCATCHRDDRRGTPPQIPALTTVAAPVEQLTATIRQGVGRMPGFPNLSPEAVRAIVAYLRDAPGHGEAPAPARATAATPATGRLRFTGYKKFLDPDGYPAVAPPWGTLSAIDLNTGDYAWQIPLGEYPELVAAGLAGTGSENYGGPIVTAGGLVFIGATNFDRKFRALAADSGRLLWQVTLPFAANTTPATYEAGGRQYVVVAAGGGKSKDPSGGMFIAYRLPRDAQRGRFP
ncbi:MAG: PQQ-binding-like beta-propeller repeat protein [Acidobacteria bacterium]|nr:PQQ-binding-like beta-propeller repeat protein [Acidobacteriota bacterium]